MLLHAVAVAGKMPIYLSLTLVLLLAMQHCRAEAEFEGPSSSSSSSSSSSTGYGRSKRGPTVGLFAFPRVGRSDSAELGLDAWDGALPPLELADTDYDDYPIKESKRQGLVPFPRVGRAGTKQDLAMAASRYWQAARKLQQQQQVLQPQAIIKRASGSGANGGMWFGPRLGKRAITGDQLL